RLLLRLRRRLRGDQVDQDRDLGGVPVAVPGGQGVRPQRLLRQAGRARPVLAGHLGRVAERASRPSRRRGRERWAVPLTRPDDRRSVVVTGASRGLGLATAAHLHRQGWTVVAAMRTPDEGLERLRAITDSRAGDPSLIGVRLDLDDHASIEDAGRVILDAVGPPHGLVHNAGLAGVGSLEEMPMDRWEEILSTNFLGPVRLTRELLPAMRIAGRGRI